MKLPDFDEEDRNLLVLAIRAGLDPTDVPEIPIETIDAWLEAGRNQKGTDAALFAAQYDSAVRDAVRTYVLAANIVRESARSDAAAAAKHLREVRAERELARSKELTAEGPW